MTPELAEKLTHAVAQGEVTLTLRNDIDVTHVETHGTFAASLLGGKEEDKRITVKEWTAKTRESKDGTLIMIQGSRSKSETAKGPR